MSGWKCVVLMILLMGGSEVCAQDYGARLGTVKRGGRVSFEPTGPGVLFDALDPAVRKWYVPQELYAEYGWRQWEYSNYARKNYQRYVSTSLEGDYFYDLFGNFLTRGWLVYDWRQTAPQPFGSTVQKTSSYAYWFNRLVVASDHQGQYHYAITVGDGIRTTLTPLTFSKPLFSGMQWDFASDKWEMTALLSRISESGSISRPELSPKAKQSTNGTNLFAGRLVAQVGDFVKVGGTLVNSHHSQTQLEAFRGNIFQGLLTEAQNFEAVSSIEIAIRDDSPEDGEGGGALFGSDILIHDLEGNETRGSEIGFRSTVEGGFQRQGYLAADGSEVIRVRYDLFSREYTGPDPSEIGRIQIELVVANDFLIEIGSNVQGVDFLPVAQAGGNVRDGSNQQVLLFDYGLPTANQVAGFTLELTDLAGLSGYMEVNLDHQYRQFPNPNTENHHASSEKGLAWLVNLSKVGYPFFVFGEAYHISPRYTTSMVVAEPQGAVPYGNSTQRFEYVDDNDDQDRLPDWRRKSWGAGDDEVFPGWDENNDFISDFNQNDTENSPNLVPDYEEPFLRFFTDRPEFLYGVDMNHNGTVDRFENDEEPDYPYRRDQAGFNVYGGFFAGPDVRLTLGYLRARQISDRRRNRAAYLLITVEKDHPEWGRLRFFQDTRRVRDSIQDDLLQWQQPPNTRGSMRLETDRLPAQNSWVSTTWLGLDHRLWTGLDISHKLKWQFYRQRDTDRELELGGMRPGSSFLGLIDKVEYRFLLGSLTLSPRWKSEFRRQTPLSVGESRRMELDELLMLILRFPIMRSSFVETGVEYEWFKQLRDPVPPGAEPSSTGWTSMVQVSNMSEYQGYRLTTMVGFELARLNYEYEPVQTRTRGFITIYAGVQD